MSTTKKPPFETKKADNSFKDVSMEMFRLGDVFYRVLHYTDVEPDTFSIPTCEIQRAQIEYFDDGDAESGPDLSSTLGDWEEVSGCVPHAPTHEASLHEYLWRLLDNIASDAREKRYELQQKGETIETIDKELRGLIKDHGFTLEQLFDEMNRQQAADDGPYGRIV